MTERAKTERPLIERLGSLALAAGVVVLTGAIVAHASQTVTVANAATFTYNLQAGADSAAITPVSNQSVFMMGTQTAPGERGVASATLLHVPSSFIEWVGIESTKGAVLTEGYSGVPGTHILYLDFAHAVDVRVASPDTILIHNGQSFVMTGDLKLIW